VFSFPLSLVLTQIRKCSTCWKTSSKYQTECCANGYWFC